MEVTIFKNFTQIISHNNITEILDQIRNGKYKKQIEALQNLIHTAGPDEYNKQKKFLPAFTPSGTFEGGRKLQYLKTYSGLVILDYDKLTPEQMNEALSKFPLSPYIFALFKSPSGMGCKLLVRVAPCNTDGNVLPHPCLQGGGQGVGTLPEFHLSAFNQVKTYYENTLPLHPDPSGKDITRLCFFSSDPDLYFNPEALVFNVVIANEEKQAPSVIARENGQPPLSASSITDDIENITTQIESTQIDITTTYDDWLKICFALVDALGPAGRDYYHRISRFNPDYTPEKCDAQFDHCLTSQNSGISIKTFFYYAKQHGILISKKQQSGSHPERSRRMTNQPAEQNESPNISHSPQKRGIDYDEKKEVTGKTRKTGRNKFHLVRDYLEENFDIRYNTVSTQFEYKEKDQDAFQPMNENNIFIRMSLDGLSFSLNNLMAFLKSDLVSSYNPFTRYFESLPPCPADTDPIHELASFVKVRSDIRNRFDTHFKKWLVRVVKCALVDSYFNKQAFILVHDKQNSGKSTFCRFLCPPALSSYIAENLSIDKDSRILLTTNLLINLDELSTLSKVEINSLKSLFSKDKINDRLPYDRKNSIIPRRASFIGSTNQAEFLNDESGSVRWLCFVIDSIDWSYKEKVSIDLIWAQAYQLFKENYPCDLTPDEIKENEEYNRQFHVTTSEFELIHKYLEPATREDHESFMSATDILLFLAESTGGKVKLNNINIGKALKMLSFSRDKKYPERTYGYFVNKKPIPF